MTLVSLAAQKGQCMGLKSVVRRDGHGSASDPQDKATALLLYNPQSSFRRLSVPPRFFVLPAFLTLLAGCSSLLLVHGIGAAIGPTLAGTLMARHVAAALPMFFAAVLGLLVLYLASRLAFHRRLRLHPTPFHPMLRTTPGALGLLPETDPPPTRKEKH